MTIEKKKRIMITLEQDQRRTHAMLVHKDNFSVEEKYKNVESIHIVADSIAYDVHHYDFIIMPYDSLDMAILECENRFCTKLYYYLNEKIRFAIIKKENLIEGEIKCSGSDSFNHPHQSCRGVLKYRVEITYRNDQ